MVRPVRPALPARPALVCAAVAAALVAPTPSAAATLGFDGRCFVPGEKATLTGGGFVARAAVRLSRGTEPVADALADGSGAFRLVVTAPEVAFGLTESQVEYAATDGQSATKALLNVVRVGAAFSPTTGDPRTMRVAHAVSGFGLGEATPSVYLHYVSPAAMRAARPARTAPAGAPTATTPPAAGPATDPAGVRTIRLGQLRGPCGILRTSPRRLFPFAAAPGTWRLQYDTRPGYVRGTASSDFLWVARTVTVAR